MAFKEFEEYPNLLERNYDILPNDSLGASFERNPINPYQDLLMELIGILEDVNEENVAHYGITLEEYFNPTAQTIQKVQYVLDNDLVEKGPNR